MKEFRSYRESDIEELMDMWNDVIEDGIYFAKEEPFDIEGFKEMLDEQSDTMCMIIDGDIAGYYIIHPNNIDRCSHIGNCSYIISKKYRGQNLGKELVEKSLEQGRELRFKGIQFNAVAAGNIPAVKIYKKLGFRIIGTVPEAFRLKDGSYDDLHIMYIDLEKED